MILSLRTRSRLRTPIAAFWIVASAAIATGGSAAAAEILSSGRSGLPWASGTSSASVDFEEWRGTRLDVRTVFMSIDTWRNMVQSGTWADNRGIAGTRTVIAQGMLPETHRGRHRECARGDYDTYMRELGSNLVASGLADAVIRLGWEANRMQGFPWGVTGDGASYKACFRRWVAMLRATPGQRFVIDWNMGARGNLPYHIDRIYPGSDVIDIIGVQQYDVCPPVRTEAEWQGKMHSYNRHTGSPFGLATWLAYAKSKGKPLSIPEWGIGGRRSLCPKPGFDNPFYIKAIHDFLRANADSIAYESYFNGDAGHDPRRGTHQLFPTDYNPRSAAVYRSLW